MEILSVSVTCRPVVFSTAQLKYLCYHHSAHLDSTDLRHSCISYSNFHVLPEDRNIQFIRANIKSKHLFQNEIELFATSKSQLAPWPQTTCTQALWAQNRLFLRSFSSANECQIHIQKVKRILWHCTNSENNSVCYSVTCSECERQTYKSLITTKNWHLRGAPRESRGIFALVVLETRQPTVKSCHLFCYWDLHAWSTQASFF